jgi:hypothetical protein
MTEATKRSIFRWVHIICGIPILGYIYDSPSDTHNYAASVRYAFLPVLLLSGLWMWKGHVLRRLISNRSALPRTESHPLPFLRSMMRERPTSKG